MKERPSGFLPGQHPIDAYGEGGFKFGGMSHRGSLLALPSGVYAWEVATAAEVDEASLARVLAEEAEAVLRCYAERGGECYNAGT